MITGRATRLHLVEASNGYELPARREAALTLDIETLDGLPVGRINVETIDDRHRSAAVTLDVGERDSVGHGHVGDALEAACRFLFARRMLHRIELTVPSDDTRAIVLYERLGFRREGVLRASLRLEGEPQDEIVMSLLTGELRERPPRA